ncbi:MAG: cysteine desulfurase, partial [Myxococcota bacterium]
MSSSQGEDTTMTDTAYDVHALRAQFPVLERNVGDRPLVYLDNAASSQMPQRVLDRLVHYQTHQHSNVHRGVHTLSQEATEAYEGARKRIQQFIGAESHKEVIFTRGTTDAINLVAHGYGRLVLKEGDEVVVSTLEHHSNIVPWQLVCKERGARLRVIPADDDGALDLEGYAALLNERTKIVAVGHVSNALGTIHPVREMIALAHEKGIPVLVDGAQAVPHLRVNVQELDCDFYAFSGHKMYGPTGIGVLYGKAALLEKMQPYQGGGDMILSVSFDETTFNELPYKFEAGTPMIAAAVALGEGVAWLDEIGLEAIAAYEHQLLEYATDQSNRIEGLRILGTAEPKAAVVSFV